MLKSKISRRLSLYFGVALLLFALIIGTIFVILFRNHTITIHKNEMQIRAEQIAETLSGYMQTDTGHGHQRGYGAYLNLIDEMAGSDVWIIDEDLTLNTCGKSEEHAHGILHYSDLPPNAEELIQEVFEDKTIFSESFSNVLLELTLTVGTPIKSDVGKVIGVVLLHSPINGINKAVENGLLLLAISILLALIISFALAVFFSHGFTKPLRKMEETAQKLAEGEYTAKSGINQNDEIGELGKTLDILAEKLEEASRQNEKMEKMRRDFVANVSHELRTPITVIRGSLEALHEKVITDPEKIEEYYVQMLSETKFLQRLVGELLDLSRLQNTDFPIEKSTLYLSDIITDAIRSASQLAEQKAVTIKLLRDNKNPTIMGDYGRLRQMFLIILDNAVKFSPNGAEVLVEWKDMQITIKDKGMGIEEEHIPYIFDRFYKIPSEDNRNGTGLGLAIAKQIADRHGILLSAGNTPNAGAVFTFKMPQE